MAKSRAPSKHSRAARRATSPGINTDKSLKDVPLPRAPSNSDAPKASTDLRPSILAVQRAAGVQKKKAKPARKSHMSARARRRHERGLEMAEAVCERTSAKVRRSLGRARVVEERRRAWDDVNRRALEAGAGAAADNAFAALADDDEEVGGEWDDEDMGAEDGGAASVDAAQDLPGTAPAAVLADDDGDEIL